MTFGVNEGGGETGDDAFAVGDLSAPTVIGVPRSNFACEIGDIGDAGFVEVVWSEDLREVDGVDLMV